MGRGSVDIAAEIAQVAGGIAFGIVGGGRSLEIADAIERGRGRFHTTRFEGSAALMAGAVGRLRSRPGVALSIKGPGLANLAAGIATAWLEDLPVVAVAEAYERSDSAAKAHKRMDHAALVGPVTKGRCGMADAGAVAHLLALAGTERPGPVLIELADTGADIPTLPPVAPRDTDAVLRAIEASHRPIVIAGAMAARAGWHASLNALSIPVFSTASAKGAVDETRPHAAGVYTGVGLELAPERAILAKADLIVGLGLRTRELLGAGTEQLIVGIDDQDEAPGFSFSAIAPTEAAVRILSALSIRSGWGSDLVASTRSRMRKALLGHDFLPAHVFTAIQDELSPARLVLDTGFFCTIGEHIWEVTDPALYLSSGQGRSMGAALPIAVAAAIHDPRVPTVLAIGDGGIGMFAAELTLAVSERAPLLVVFMSDGTYASVRDRAVDKGLTERPLILRAPDWTAVAGAMGFAAARAGSLTDVVAFLDRWKVAGGPGFIQIDFSPEPYRAMTRMLRA